MTNIEKLTIDRFLAQAELLAQLLAHHAYQTYGDLLREMRQAAFEELATCESPSDVKYWQGVIATLAEVLARPARIVAEAAHYSNEEEAAGGPARTGLRALLSTTPPDDL